MERNEFSFQLFFNWENRIHHFSQWWGSRYVTGLPNTGYYNLRYFKWISRLSANLNKNWTCQEVFFIVLIVGHSWIPIHVTDPHLCLKANKQKITNLVKTPLHPLDTASRRTCKKNITSLVLSLLLLAQTLTTRCQIYCFISQWIMGLTDW